MKLLFNDLCGDSDQRQTQFGALCLHTARSGFSGTANLQFRDASTWSQPC